MIIEAYRKTNDRTYLFQSLLPVVSLFLLSLASFRQVEGCLVFVYFAFSFVFNVLGVKIIVCSMAKVRLEEKVCCFSHDVHGIRILQVLFPYAL